MMQQIILTHTSSKKSEKYFLQNFQLTLILPDLRLANKALSSLIDKYRQIINIGIVDSCLHLTSYSNLPYLTSLDIFDMYKVHRPSRRHYQRSLSRPNIDLHTISKIQSFLLSVVIIKI